MTALDPGLDADPGLPWPEHDRLTIRVFTDSSDHLERVHSIGTRSGNTRSMVSVIVRRLSIHIACLVAIDTIQDRTLDATVQ